ncbi:hypothetical protein BHF68_07430 [Desulfuribacillus alkaliarsenatis]|uniref:GH18 domain-containing protein n=1 Tax=Desulfuribacillus alkaliarsenatis TaxID=766136 RepID=A0A1E5G1A1_9FIRM|nr:hypothetical protein BHF68_07430 [Desulfuribacillus alkaliarsenatis]
MQRKTHKQSLPWHIIITMLLITSFITFGVFAWVYLVPNYEEIRVYSLDEVTTIFDHEKLEEIDVQIIDGTPYLSYTIMKELFDPYLHWDEGNQLLIMTTETQVIELKTEQLTAFFNSEPVDLEVPVRLIEETPYLPLEFFASYYSIKPRYVESTNTLIIESIGIPVQKGRVNVEEALVRLDAHIKEPIVARLNTNAEVDIIGQKGNWYQVQTREGIFGFVNKSDIQLAGIQMHKAAEEARHVPWKPLGGKINLTWEHVHRATPNPADIPLMPGVNVISPTWFYLKDADGNVSGSKASIDYVDWAHDQGIHVWALYDNQFDPDLTGEFLRNPEARKRSIRQLLGYAELYKLDGINIDFENVYYEDKDYLTQYVRELTPYLREQGLVVSIDVTILSSSPNWSMVYDRVAYADTVDYVMVMTYDEHWGSSPVAGSVASLPWVERGLQGVLQQVPKDKLILGVPFYTRVWKEEAQAVGSIKVSSRAVSMQLAWNIIEENNATVTFDDKAMQYYAEYFDGNDRYRIWLETVESMEERVKLVRKYDLAGIASWRRGFELPEIWETIQTFLEKQPKELVLED